MSKYEKKNVFYLQTLYATKQIINLLSILSLRPTRIQFIRIRTNLHSGYKIVFAHDSSSDADAIGILIVLVVNVHYQVVFTTKSIRMRHNVDGENGMTTRHGRP